jgi:hydrogenase assembly chaperone HypC/HupF
MCLSYPGRVMSVHEDCVLVDEDGRRRRASRLIIPDLQPGDWVLVAAGAVVERLDPREAEAIIAMLDAAAMRGERAAQTDATGGPS